MSSLHKRISYAISILLAMMIFPGVAAAQNPPDFNSGLTPYQGFHGGDIDSINMANGNVNLRIPLISFPQRGGTLRLNFVLNYNSTVVKKLRHNTPGHYAYLWEPVDGNPFSPAVLDDQTFLKLAYTGVCSPSDCRTGSTHYHYYSVGEFDGAQHVMGYTQGNPTTTGAVALRSLDLTGLSLSVSNPPSNSNFTITDRSGTRSTGVYPFITKREDSNGNYITYDSTQHQYIDTIGRIFASPPTPDTQGSPDSTYCQGPLPITKSVLWQVPGKDSGTYTIKFCFAVIYVYIYNDDGDYGTSPTVLQSIILPDATTGSLGGTTTAYVFEYNDVENGGNCSVPLSGDCYGSLTKITLPTGGSITYSYGMIGDFKDTQRAVVSRTVSDGTSSQTWNYAYTIPTSQNGWTGTTVVTAPQQSYDTQRNDTVHTTKLWGSLDFETGFEVAAAYYQGQRSSGTLLETITKTFTGISNPYYTDNPLVSPGFGPARAGMLPLDESRTLPDGKVSKAAYTYDNNQAFTIYDNYNQPRPIGHYGLLTTQTDYDGIVPIRSTTTQYIALFNQNYLTWNILDRATSGTIVDGAGHLKASTSNSYDEYNLQPSRTSFHLENPPPNQSIRGNRTTVGECSVVTSDSCSTSINTTYSFYTDGNVYRKTDPSYIDGQTGQANQAVTTYEYSLPYQAAYPTKTTLPVTGGTVSHIVSADYDLNTGTMSKFTDQNNQATNYTYDYARRLTLVSYPDGGQSVIHYYDTPPQPYLTTTTLISSGIGSLTKQVTFDGLGRTIQDKLTSDPEGTGTDTVDTTYDAVGNVYTVSNPYRSTGESTYGLTTYRYDALKRKVLEIPTDGTASSNNVRITYNSEQVTVTDEAGKTRTMQYDALGRLVYVWEAGTTYKTDYQYDALSNLTLAQQEGDAPTDQTKWRKRTFAYDPLSRLTQSYNPESGYRYFKYVRTDGANCSPQTASVCQRTDAIGNVTTYTFDALARPYQTSYSVQSPTVSTPSVTNYYDQTSYNGLTITYGTGRRTGMADNSGSGLTAWSYDQVGRTTQQRKTIAGVTLPVSYQYNLDGSLKQLTYPDATVEMYNYSTAGRGLSVVDSTGLHNYGKNATYSAAGGLVTLLMANSAGYAGNTLTQSYNKRLQLGVTSAATPTQTIFSLTNDFQLTYADNGNVWNITNNLDSTRSQTFAYDSLNRLSTAGTASTWGDPYVYDPWGNLYQMNVTRGSGQSLQQTIDPNNNRFVGWTYDANGNLIAGGGATNSFDAENRLVALSPGSFSYVYDGDGARVRKSNGSVTTLFWRDLAGKVLAETDGSGNPQQDYIYLNGVMIARSDVTHGHPRLDYYYIHDHLGTTRMITNPTGGICYDADYFPYGMEQATPINSCAQNYKFTAKERDSESGLDDFGERYYSSALGRFMSADPQLTDLKRQIDPQQLNMYGYGRNNPLRYTDDSGEEVKEAIHVVTYAVHGATANEALANASATSGFKSETGEAMSGNTSATMKITNTNVETSLTPGSPLVDTFATSEVKSADVKLDQTITLPSWTEQSNASPDEQKAFSTAVSGLKEHEEGHAAINRQQAEKLDKSLPGTTGTGQAKTPQEALNKAMKNMVQKEKNKAQQNNAQTRTQQQDYDKRTDHGRKQHEQH